MIEDDTLSLDVDIDSMTLGEMETVEDLTGLGLDEIGAMMSKPGPKVKVLTALAFVVRRRTHPDVTLDDVKSMRISLADADPKESPGTGDTPGSASQPASLSVVSYAI